MAEFGIEFDGGLLGKARKRMMAEAIVLFLCFGLGLCRFLYEESKRSYGDLIKENTEIELQGRVDWVKESEYGVTLMLSNVTLAKKERGSLKLVAFVSEADGILPGDRIRADGVLREFDRAGNPGEFDSFLYYRSLGCQYSCEIEAITGVKRAKLPIYRMLMAVRSRLQSVYQVICKEDAAGVYQAMLLGEKSELLAETKELYSDGGISHILAISGLHIAVLGMGLYRALRRVGGFRTSGVLAGLVICLYVIMTGSAVSACRAGIMFVIQLLSFIVKRSYDMLSAAAAALLVLLWHNPWYLFHSGCQLSFGAVFAIGLVYPSLSCVFGAKRPIAKALLSSLSVSLVTFPILSCSFYELSPYSILLNLIVIPCMTLVMLSGLMGGTAGFFWLGLGKFLVALGQYILQIYATLCRWICLLPYSKYLTGKPSQFILMLYYLLLTCLVAICMALFGRQNDDTKKNDVNRLFYKLFLAGSFLLLPFLLGIRMQRNLYVCFLNVSQGDGIFIQTEDNIRILVDGGSSDKRNLYQKSLLPFLKSRGVDALDFAVVTHPDEDHISALKELIEQGEIALGQLLLPRIDKALQDEAYCNLAELAKENGITVGYLSQGDRLCAGSLIITCLYPYKGLITEDRNGYSTVLEVKYKEYTMLLTGDLDEAGEEYLSKHVLGEGKKYTLLKVAHHGSKYSTTEAFLEKVKAEYAVISCGKKNRYGHPHDEVLQRLEQAGIKVRITAEEGAIQMSPH